MDWVAPVQNDTSVGLLCHHREIDGNSASETPWPELCRARQEASQQRNMGSKCGTLPSWDPLCTCKSVCIRRETTCLPPIQLHRLLFTDFVVFQNECFQRWIPRKKIFQWFSCFTLLYDLIFKSGTCDCSFYSLQQLFSKFQIVTIENRHTKSAPCPENYECQSTRACGNMWKAHESVLLVSMTRTLVRKVCRARTPSHVWACPHPIPIRSTVENTASAMRKDDRKQIC